eukprot:1422745-Rhodomonas_salina.3
MVVLLVSMAGFVGIDDDRLGIDGGVLKAVDAKVLPKGTVVLETVSDERHKGALLARVRCVCDHDVMRPLTLLARACLRCGISSPSPLCVTGARWNAKKKKKKTHTKTPVTTAPTLMIGTERSHGCAGVVVEREMKAKDGLHAGGGAVRHVQGESSASLHFGTADLREARHLVFKGDAVEYSIATDKATGAWDRL